MNPSASAQIPASVRLRPLIIGLGWLGLVLFVVNVVVSTWPVETTNYLLLRVFDIVMTSLLALWPVAVWLQVKPWLGKTGHVIATVLLILLILPWWGLCFLVAATEDSAVWEEHEVRYESVDPPVRIVQQYRFGGFATSGIEQRVVKITPLWGPWQHVEPADTARFPV